MPTIETLHLCNQQVSAGAQILPFDAMAAVVLSDGTTCSVEAPESQIRAKGYKHAEPFPSGMTTRIIPYTSYLDASSSGYEERYVDGILVV